MKYIIGYYLNRYAGWYRVRQFNTPIELVQWLKTEAKHIDGAIDFIAEK